MPSSGLRRVAAILTVRSRTRARNARLSSFPPKDQRRLGPLLGTCWRSPACGHRPARDVRASCSQPNTPDGRERAETNEIVTALTVRGVLTLVELRDICRADFWPEREFTTTLRRAVASREIRHLGDERYESAQTSSPADSS